MIRDEIIAELLKLPAEKSVLCQVAAEDGSAWGMHFQFEDAQNTTFIQLRVWHPQLKRMPTFLENTETVPLPQNADQAAGMVLVATAWLEQHAPERLKTPNV